MLDADTTPAHSALETRSRAERIFAVTPEYPITSPLVLASHVWREACLVKASRSGTDLISVEGNFRGIETGEVIHYRYTERVLSAECLGICPIGAEAFNYLFSLNFRPNFFPYSRCFPECDFSTVYVPKIVPPRAFEEVLRTRPRPTTTRRNLRKLSSRDDPEAGWTSHHSAPSERPAELKSDRYEERTNGQKRTPSRGRIIRTGLEHLPDFREPTREEIARMDRIAKEMGIRP